MLFVQNIAAIKVADLSGCKPRTQAANIPLNKFVVLLKEGEPVEVWTGSTNMTKGGIYGHSNVGHVVRDPTVAATFLEYWKQLSKDPAPSRLQSWTVKKAGDQPERWTKSSSSADLEPQRSSTTIVFSPRESVAALKWYAKLISAARPRAQRRSQSRRQDRRRRQERGHGRRLPRQRQMLFSGAPAAARRR